MSVAIYERFLSPSTMMEAEQELLAMGAEALPILESLLAGEAKNRFGVPYRTLGLPLQCTLEVARRLGPVAKPLERYFREELKRGDRTAAMALGSLGHLEDTSVIALAAALQDQRLDIYSEAAAAIVRCGAEHHPAVVKAMDESPEARARMTRFGRCGEGQRLNFVCSALMQLKLSNSREYAALKQRSVRLAAIYALGHGFFLLYLALALVMPCIATLVFLIAAETLRGRLVSASASMSGACLVVALLGLAAKRYANRRPV